MFKKAFGDKRQHLKVDPEVDLSDLLYAREALAIIEKTSNALVRKNTKSTLNSLIIGQVCILTLINNILNSVICF